MSDDKRELDEIINDEVTASEGAEDQVVEEEVEAQEAEADTDALESIAEELAAYPTWKEESRQAWESLASNQEYHDALKGIKAQLDDDYRYRTQLEEQRKELEGWAQYGQGWQQIEQQYADVLQGNPAQQVASQLFYAAKQLQSDPQGTILRLAKDYGVDLNAALQDQPYVDEYTQRLERELQEVKQSIQSQQLSAQQQQYQSIVEQARAFEFETDAEGNRKHPYVAEVANDMLALVYSGRAQSWADAYERAVWMNPEIRQKVMAQQAQAEKLQRSEQARKAKAAASAQPKSGKSSATADKKAESLDDAIGRAFEEIEAA